MTKIDSLKDSGLELVPRKESNNPDPPDPIDMVVFLISTPIVSQSRSPSYLVHLARFAQEAGDLTTHAISRFIRVAEEGIAARERNRSHCFIAVTIAGTQVNYTKMYKGTRSSTYTEMNTVAPGSGPNDPMFSSLEESAILHTET